MTGWDPSVAIWQPEAWFWSRRAAGWCGMVILLLSLQSKWKALWLIWPNCSVFQHFLGCAQNLRDAIVAALYTHFLSLILKKYRACVNLVCTTYVLINNFFLLVEPTGSKDSKSARFVFRWYLPWKDFCRLCPGAPQVEHASQGTLQTVLKSLNTSTVSSWHTSSWRWAAMTASTTGAGDLAATSKSSFDGARNTDITPSSWFCDLPDDFCGDRNGGKKSEFTCTQKIPAALS